MLIGILTLATALAISAVAIYYSVSGLVAIFAAAAIPIMIMGGVLEVSKLVTAVWLHRNWKKATWWLKTYLSTAVLVLMLITSMGIFGYLSKAHIEQTQGAKQDLAQIEQVEERLQYNVEVIRDAEEKIEELRSSGSTVETNIRKQIKQEQERIDSAYDKIQPAIQEQREIIERQTKLYQTQIDKINQDLERLQGYIENDEIRKAQAVVGTTVDGDYGPATARAFKAYQERKVQEREELISKIETSLDNNETVQRARAEISALQERAAAQVADAERSIERLRSRLNSNSSNNIETLIAQQNVRIQEASAQIETLTDKKFEMETSYRQLEAEVGPLRYIAEFIYGGEAGTDVLEKAVQWVIVIIIFVFDPLAVLLLIASQYSIVEHQRGKRETDLPDVEEPRDDATNNTQSVASWLMSGTYDFCKEHRGPYPKGGTCPRCELKSASVDELETEPDKTVVPPEPVFLHEEHKPDLNELNYRKKDVTDEDLEKLENDLVSELADDERTEVSEEFKSAREKRYKEKEMDEEFVNKKTKWKADHPDETLKHYKKLYIHGVIDSLPWE